MSQLVERLRRFARMNGADTKTCDDAADAIEELEAEVARLREERDQYDEAFNDAMLRTQEGERVYGYVNWGDWHQWQEHLAEARSHAVAMNTYPQHEDDVRVPILHPPEEPNP